MIAAIGRNIAGIGRGIGGGRRGASAPSILWTPADDYTFTRPITAMFKDIADVEQEAAIDELRDMHYHLGEPTVWLEDVPTQVTPDAPTEPVLTNLALWLDASEITATDGDAISSWADISGNARHATQATSANQPLYKTGIINSLPVVRFDGANDYLIGTATNSTERTVFLVAQKRSAPTSSNKAVFALVNTNAMLITNSTSGGSAWRYQSPSTTIGGTATDPSILALNFSALSVCTPEVNGVSGTPFDPHDGYITNGNIRIGAGDGTGTNPGDYDVGEVLVYAAALSTEDQALVTEYLKAKWGIA